MILRAPRLLAALLLLAGGVRLAGDVTLAPLFTDGLVLQRDRTVPVWGSAAPGEKILVAFAGQRREATAGPDGRWLVLLEPLAATQEASELLVSGTNTCLVRDVIVGDVWLVAGDALLDWPLDRDPRAVQERLTLRSPYVREVRLGPAAAVAPTDEVTTSGWRMASSERVGEFSAAGYAFARDLAPRLGVPIGLITAATPGRPFESWMSPASLMDDPRLVFVAGRWEKLVSTAPARQEEHERRLAAWRQAEAAARALGKAALETFWRKEPRPVPPLGRTDEGAPSRTFNALINPLLPAAIRGVLWSQSESVLEGEGDHAALLRRLVASWRGHFGQGELPFLWVQAPARRLPADPSGLHLAQIRGEQGAALDLPGTAQVVSLDLGYPDDPGGWDGGELGRRLALLARTRVYGLVADDSGPEFERAEREGTALRVRFDHAAGGLIARDRPVGSLQLAGPDGVWHPATGRIERDTLVVSSPAVPNPVALRYAWSNAPEANLYNGAGLPAGPFEWRM